MCPMVYIRGLVICPLGAWGVVGVYMGMNVGCSASRCVLGSAFLYIRVCPGLCFVTHYLVARTHSHMMDTLCALTIVFPSVLCVCSFCMSYIPETPWSTFIVPCHTQSCRTDSYLLHGHFVCANYCISKCTLCLLILHIPHTGDTLEYLDCVMPSTPSNYKFVHDNHFHGDEDHDPRSDLSEGGR